MANVLADTVMSRKVTTGLSPRYRAHTTFRFWRARGFGSQLLLSSLECALGIVAVILIAALAHWSSWLLPVAVLLYLLIVVPMALFCGFWQAAIVSLSAVVAQSLFTVRHPQLA
ncbi:MAG: hypothetical protein WBA18_11320, partial [Terracidiphilus sp.]